MLRFLRETLASTLGALLAIGLILGFLLGGLPQPVAPDVPDRGLLVIDLSAGFVDNPVPSTVSDLVLGTGSASPVPLSRVRDALRAAAADERIIGLELIGVAGPMGWATLAELRREIVRFGDSGKRVMADLEYVDEAGMYLASAADKVYLPPLSELEWNGFAAELEYLARALEKAGVDMQVTRVGKYKSAVEPFLEQEMSPENREQITAILEQRTAMLMAAVVEGRGLENDEALRDAMQQEGLLSAVRAEELGLIDGVRYWDEVAGELRGWAGDHDPDQAGDLSYSHIDLEDYLRDPVCAEDTFAPGATVAVVYAEGDIVDWGGPGSVSANDLVLELAELRDDPDIAAVVLRVQSPGGSASASEFILREVELLADEKPLIVSMGDVAASGGYWIASQASEIYAEPSTITGSIGVFGMFPNVAGLADRLGVDIETVTTGPHANLSSLYEPMSPATLAQVQASVDRVYEDFLVRVVDGRGLDRGLVEEIAQGRVWTGEQAHTFGLVDQLGSLPDAIERAAELAGLKEGYAVEHGYYRPDEWEQLLQDLMRGAEDQLAGVQGMAWPATAQLAWQLLQPRHNRTGVWARLPWVARWR